MRSPNPQHQISFDPRGVATLQRTVNGFSSSNGYEFKKPESIEAEWAAHVLRLFSKNHRNKVQVNLSASKETNVPIKVN